MKIRNYIFALTTILLGTACSQEESISAALQGDDDIQFTATIEENITAESRALGDNKAETVTLPYVYNIRIRKVDINSGGASETKLFNVRTGNYGTLDVVNEKGESTGTAMKWTDKANNVDFYAWTVPTGVSINDDATTGTVDFQTGNKYNAGSTNISDKFADKTVTPLEVLIGTYTKGKYTENPSVSLGFKHLVSKVKVIVYWYDKSIITDNVKIIFPYIKQTWNIEQNQKASKQEAFGISTSTGDADLTLSLKNLAGNNNGRYFYLPPMTGDYAFDKAGDFEIIHENKTYYGSLADTQINQLAAGEYMELTIYLNENYNAGAGATIAKWDNVNNLEAYANPYCGIYTQEGLKVLKKYLDSNDPNKELPDSLFIKGTGELAGKKIIRLYNDLSLPEELSSLVLEKNMIFDGLGHTVTVPTGKSLFGDISKTGIAINNIRLEGEGQLANSLTGVTVYNCHANGTGNLVGTAKNNTTFNFCSTESAGKLLATTTEGTVTMQNCFIAYDGAEKFAGTEGTVTAKNSFIFNTTTKKGTYYDSNGTEVTNNITLDNQTDQLVIIDNTQSTPKTEKLIDLLNQASNNLNSTTDKKYWVYVYGKEYPVVKIE